MKKILICSGISLFLLALYSASTAFAQVKDTVKTIKKNDSVIIFGFTEDAFKYSDISPFRQKIDSSLKGFQKHGYLNGKTPFITRFANTGLAYRNLDFNSEFSSGFISSRQYFKNYFFTNETSKYYYANTPVAEASLVMGSKREQVFDVFFTRNLKKNLNVSAKYRLIHSPGKYLYQKSDDAFVLFTGNYSSENKKYTVLGNYFYNRLKIQENGGLQNDSDFTGNTDRNRQLLDVNLSDAENRVKESGFYIRQFYFTGSCGTKKRDSAKAVKPCAGFGRISHSILFKNQSQVYYDKNPLSGFYQGIPADTTLTRDSLHINIIENTLEWSNLKYKTDSLNQRCIFSAGIKHRYSKLYGQTTDTAVGSFIPQAEIIIKAGNSIEVDAGGFYYLSGFNKNDFSFAGKINHRFRIDSASACRFGIKANLFKQLPAWFDRRYSSNNFSWTNNFEQIYSKKAGLFFNCKTLDLSVSLTQINNFVYYDIFALPKQFKDDIEIMQFNLCKSFKWKSWETDNRIIYQKSFGSTLIRLPDFMSDHAVYFTRTILKKAMTAQIGMEAVFFSSYKPLAWMPATREFYLNNNFSSDNYVYFDFFVNLRIKRLRVYLKMDHINSGITGYNYFMIPNYPMSDRSFKLGLSWLFFD